MFHDSSDSPFHAHAYFFVPAEKVPLLLAPLLDARQKFRCETKLHFNEFSGKKWGQTEHCAAHWVGLGTEALRRHGQKWFSTPVNCRLGAIAFPKSVKLDLSRYAGDADERYVRWVETLIRIGLKSALHSCYSQSERVAVSEFCTDGQPYNRPLDADRILGRLRTSCASHVEILPDALVRPIVSDHRVSECISKSRAHLLQLTDLLLGAVLSSISGAHTDDTKKERLSRPIRDMLDKAKRGRHFARSGHYRTFSTTHATLIDGAWQFSPLAVTDPKRLWQQLELDVRDEAV